MKNSELNAIRELINLPGNDLQIGDFEEHIQMAAVRESLRTWFEKNTLAAFAYVDEFANLWFEVAPGYLARKLESEIIQWGVEILQKRNREAGENATLDANCKAHNKERIEILRRNGFVQQSTCSLQYELALKPPVTLAPFPAGYTWRHVTSADPVEDLVALHRLAFGTENMTVDYRRAMMRAPQYEMNLDLLAIASDGSLAGFCICSVDETYRSIGNTDPIGVHPQHQGKGLAKALTTVGINLLAQRGVTRVQTGTSSENLGMQALANSLGFKCISEKLWFSKDLEEENGSIAYKD
jgi:mycothiol synthase